MSDETRSPDEPQMPSGSDPKPSPESPASGETPQHASPEAQPAPASATGTEADPAGDAKPGVEETGARAPAAEAVGAKPEESATPAQQPAMATPPAAAPRPADTDASTSNEETGAVAEAPASSVASSDEPPVEAASMDASAAEGQATASSETPASDSASATAAPADAAAAASAPPDAEAAATPAATDEAATTAEPSITTPEEAEAFVRSVRAAVSATLPDTLEKGQEVRALVKALEDEVAVLDVAKGRFEVRLPKLDFVDASGRVSIAQGDEVDLILEELGEPPVFKRRSSPIGEAIGKIAEAFAGREPLEGKITSSIKGGFEVKLEGLRAFLPGSQATLRRSDDKSKLVGQTLPLMVTKFDPSGRSIVVSRRKILDKERKQEARQTRERLAKGATFTGRVVALQAYGAFVDIGGIQGLLHLTEISWSRLRKPDEALKVGQRVDVKVLEHDEAGKKVSLSMRALLEDPWKALGAEVKPNQVRTGKILRIVKSGGIVELAPGIEARLASTELAPDGELTAERRKELVGQDFAVQVVEFDAKRHRASLLAAPEGAEPGSIVEPPEVKAGAKIKGLVERSAPFGLFIRLAPGKLGLLHATETNTPPGTDLGKEFPPGTPLQVEVLEVNEEEGRIRLTRRTVFDRMKDRERQNARQGRGGPRRDGPGGGRGDRRGGRSSGPLVNPAQAPKGGGFASFGDVLKSAIAKPAEAPPAEAPPAEAPPAEAPPAGAALDTPTEPSAEAGAAAAAPEVEAASPPAPEAPSEEPVESARKSAPEAREPEAATEAATAGGAGPDEPEAGPTEPATEPPSASVEPPPAS